MGNRKKKTTTTARKNSNVNNKKKEERRQREAKAEYLRKKAAGEAVVADKKNVSESHANKMAKKAEAKVKQQEEAKIEKRKSFFSGLLHSWVFWFGAFIVAGVIALAMYKPPTLAESLGLPEEAILETNADGSVVIDPAYLETVEVEETVIPMEEATEGLDELVGSEASTETSTEEIESSEASTETSTSVEEETVSNTTAPVETQQ